MFIAKIAYWYDTKEEIDTIIVKGDKWAEAIDTLENYYGEDLTTILYMEPWDDMVIHIDDDFMNDINRIKDNE